MRPKLLLCLAAVLCLATTSSQMLRAQTAENSYAQYLIDQTLKNHPDILVLMMHVTPPNSTDNVVIASNIGRIGKKADEDDLAVIKTGTPKLEVNAKGDRFEVELPLLDASRRTVGALGVVFPYKAGDDKEQRHREAVSVRDELARRISHVENLMEALRFDTKTPINTYAQQLVDETMKKYPELVIMVMHVTPPQGPDTDNVILGSSIGRIGKKADEDDLRVMRTGKTNLEVNSTGERFEVELVLQDVSGNTLGALGLVFPYKEGADKEAFRRKAEAIRNEVSRRITNGANLFEPFPYDPKFSPNTFAQRLVDETLAKHPEVLILAIHAIPPGGTKSVILASNIGRHGKEDSEDDLAVVRTGKPYLQVKEPGNRYLNIVVLKDASGKTIGALAVNFPYKAGEDKSKLEKRALQIRDEMAKKIPSLTALVKPIQADAANR